MRTTRYRISHKIRTFDVIRARRHRRRNEIERAIRILSRRRRSRRFSRCQVEIGWRYFMRLQSLQTIFQLFIRRFQFVNAILQLRLDTFQMIHLRFRKRM